MTFLSDAHERGVLRQVGPVYQFRHIELQRWLASQCSGDKSPTWLQQVAVRQGGSLVGLGSFCVHLYHWRIGVREVGEVAS